MADETHDPTTPPRLDKMLSQVAEETSEFDWGEDGGELEESELLTLLQFSKGGQRYAILGEEVREVLNRAQSTELPGAPPHILGIMIHRRQVIGLLDLDVWFGLTPKMSQEQRDEEQFGRVILVERESLVAGILAGASTTIVQWSSDLIGNEVPESIPPQIKRYIKAIKDDEEGAVLLLDITRLLEDAAVG